MPRREYTAALKAKVLGALLLGQTISEVSLAFDVPMGTVSAWQTRNNTELARNAIAPAPLSVDEKASLGDLLISYVKECLTTLKVQQEMFRDPIWLRKQNASAIAVLHGVVSDKSIRILGALAQGERDDGYAPLARLPEQAGDRCDNDI